MPKDFKYIIKLMKILIDYDLKIVSLQQSAPLPDFLDWVNEHIGDIDGWVLETNSVCYNNYNEVYPLPPAIPNISTPLFQQGTLNV